MIVLMPTISLSVGTTSVTVHLRATHPSSGAARLASVSGSADWRAGVIELGSHGLGSVWEDAGLIDGSANAVNCECSEVPGVCEVGLIRSVLTHYTAGPSNWRSTTNGASRPRDRGTGLSRQRRV